MVQRPANSDEAHVAQEIRDVTTPLLKFVEEELREGTGDAIETYRFAARALASEIEALAADDQDGVAAARQLVQSHQRANEFLSSCLVDVLANLTRLQQVRERREKYSPRWLDQTLTGLHRTFAEAQEVGFQKWVQLYAQTLADWELDTCSFFVKTEFAFAPHHLPYVLLIRHGDASIQKKEYQPAIRMLHYIAQRLANTTNEESRLLAALLLIFIGRIHLYQMNDAESAQEMFVSAALLAPHDGRPLAAQGHSQLARGDEGWAEANQLFSRAIEFSPHEPDGYVGKAIMAENRKLWSEADDWCKAAAQTQPNEPDLLKYLTRMLAPAPGRLFLLVAEQAFAAGAYEHALQAVERSIELGVNVGDGNASGAPPALKADTLMKLAGGRPSPEQAKNIADLYLEAGKCYYWENNQQLAEKMFERGLELDDQNSQLWFYSADALRILSHSPRPPYYVSEELVRGSLKSWERGLTLVKNIGPDEAWVYVARSSISKQVACLPGEDAREHYWQSVLFIERALLLNVSRTWWANLSGSYNGLFLYANMLHVSLKAEEGMPKDVATLEERAKVLINTGQFKPAEAILNELRSNESIDPPIRLLYQSWQAVIDYYAGNYPEAQKNIGALLDQSPDDFWGICLRSNIWLAIGKQQHAMDDVEWIWKRRDDPRHKDQQFEFARAAFLKGMFSETLLRLQPILTTASGDERFSALLFAGLCNLATGNLPVAEDQLSEALEISNPRSVIDFVIELKQLEERSKRENWKEQTAIGELLNKPESVLKRALQKQREVKTYEADPIKELEVVLAGPATGQVGSWSWLAAQASLGRLYVEANRKAEARRVYSALSEFPNAIPEARTTLASLDSPEGK